MTTATAPSARPGIGRGRSLEDCENRLELAAQILHRLRGECAPCLGLELTRAAVLLDLLTRALDRVFLGVQQVLHQHDQLDLASLVHPVSRAVFRGVQEAELALPVAEHVRLQIGELAYLADREEFLDGVRDAHRRSEEHTSELQSRLHLVCRLLLEKKKNHSTHKNAHAEKSKYLQSVDHPASISRSDSCCTRTRQLSHLTRQCATFSHLCLALSSVY